MSAKDSLSQQFYYHGTTHDFKEGDELLPQKNTLHGPSTGNHVYMTDRDIAEEYAHMAVEQLVEQGHNADQLTPRVYQVEPVGKVEEDPSGMRLLDDDDNAYTLDRRAPKARIIKKVWEGYLRSDDQDE